MGGGCYMWVVAILEFQNNFERREVPLNMAMAAGAASILHTSFRPRKFNTSVIPPSLDKPRRRFQACRASWQELAGVLIFSAIPFTAVKAIANSPLGVQLQDRMQQTKLSAIKETPQREAASRRARNDSIWYGKDRPRWLWIIPYEYPDYLNGEAPGDYGFDIAGLSKDKTKFDKYFNFEVLHARWAMLAALGVVIPELLDLFGAVDFIEPVWWRVGYAKLKGDTLDYLGIPGLHIAGAQGVLVIAVCQFLLMGFDRRARRKPGSQKWQIRDGVCIWVEIVGPEYARYCGIEALEPLGIYLPGDENYPGGILFDPLGLSNDPVAFEELKVKEIKNGRLAMVAWLGFYAQAALTGKGPIENLRDHINDPVHNNVATFVSSILSKVH